MLKVLLISGLIALSAAATLYAPADTEIQGCLYQDELWGSEDGTKFYFCLPGTDIALEQNCPSNTFFVRNATTCGCVPLTLVNPNCIYTEPVGACTGNNLVQPQVAPNPAQFYLCPTEGATPVLLPCPEGTAFIKQDGYLGCFEWTQYRTMRDCPE